MFYREHKRVTKFFDKPSRAKQSFKKECDINTIMARAQKTGLVEHVAAHGGRYDEFPSRDLHEAAVMVQAAGQMFMSLPSDIRADFENDAEAFLAFAEDPENEDAMREYGLLPKQAPGEPEGGAGEPSPL